MISTEISLNFTAFDDIFELNVDELEQVAGGPEVPNDPGHD